MKWSILFFLFLCACSDTANKKGSSADSARELPPVAKPVPVEPEAEDTSGTKKQIEISSAYSNARFKDVRVQRTGNHEFLITGKGQIFEANFNWVIEDGHEEIIQGHEATDAGAPAWGNFSFRVNVEKKRPNSTLHLVLYEVSAEDGSRKYQLPLLLY